MAAIQCKMEIPAIQGLNDNELTVGREFLLVCEGEFPRTLVQEKLHFVLRPQEKYQIQLLGFEFRTPTQADLKVTAYRAGQSQFQDLQVTDGTEVLSLGPIQYVVQSVLPKPEPGQPQAKQEPFGPIGPASLGVPMLYWAILAGVVGLAALIFVVRVVRVVQRRSMLARLREHDSALSPMSQFHQSFRRLQRVNTVFFGGQADPEHIKQCLDETSTMFRLFLTRKYQVPALEWNDRLILKDIKKYYPQVFAEYSEDLKKLLKEYARGFEDKDRLKERDVLNIATNTRLLVEKLERVS